MKNDKNSKKALAAGISCLVLAVAVGAGIVGLRAGKDGTKENAPIASKSSQEPVSVVSANKNSGSVPIAEMPRQNDYTDDESYAAKSNTVSEKTAEAAEKTEAAANTVPAKSQPQPAKSESAKVQDEEETAQSDENIKPVFAWPVKGDIVMDYSTDVPVFDQTLEQYRTNDCISIAADKGDKVFSAAAGTVESIAENDEKGCVVTVFHGNGWRTTYGQLDKDLAVREGDIIAKGDLIGVVGEPSKYSVMLGNHMDFGITENGESIDPKTALAK